jgi:putative transposase
MEAPKLQSGERAFRPAKTLRQKNGFSPGPNLAHYTVPLYYSLMYFTPQSLRTFFVTSGTASHRAVLQSERMASLLMNCLFENRQKERFLLHEFVIMPDHFHALITPAAPGPLEKAMQFIKGGFSYRAGKELNVSFAIWQPGFTDHRIRDLQDYEHHRSYIQQNPVTARLVNAPELFPYSSAFPGTAVDPAPPWLKPAPSQAFSRGA